MVSILRWLTIVPAAVVAWYVAFIASIALLAGLGSLCPPEKMVSGACIAPWYRVISDAMVGIGAGLAALLILLVCTLLAPTHKPQVAVATFVAGSLVAAFMGFSSEAYVPLGAAIGAGALGLWMILHRLQKREPWRLAQFTRGGGPQSPTDGQLG